SDTVKTVIAQLEKSGKVTRGWIGVQIQQVTPDIAESLGVKNTEGALVAEPQADSPAAKAGIQAGDVIATVDGQPVKNARELARKISSMAPGTSAKLGVWRKGEEKALTLTLGIAEHPAGSCPDRARRDEPRQQRRPARPVARPGGERRRRRQRRRGRHPGRPR